MSLLFFKVWNPLGGKSVIYLPDGDNLLLNLIVKASAKFEMNGSKIVLEKDGTDMDDDIVLKHFQNETFVLLESGQVWPIPEGENSNKSVTTSCASTVTIDSVNDLASVSGSINDVEDGECNVNNRNYFETVNATTSKDVSPPYQIDCNSSFMWKMFQIPWQTFPKYIIAACEKGNSKDIQAKTFIIQTVVNKMREIKTHLPASAIHVITQKILDKYPEMFRDVDEDGVVIGDGTHTVFRKILDRNNYLNRNKRSFSSSQSPATNKKCRVAERAGCIAWNPSPEETLDDVVEDLNLLPSDPRFDEKMNTAFGQQRKFILENPTVHDVKKVWPILLSKEGAFFHFKQLTSSEYICVSQAVNGKWEKFKKLALANNYVLDMTKPKLLLMLFIITRQFGDLVATFYKECEGDIIDNGLLDTFDEMHPCILKTSSSQKYSLVYEKELIHEEENFDDVFAMAFCFYFNFNLKYPPRASLTFDFIQRYIFKIHPDSGSKINKKTGKQVSKTKVITLMKKFRDM